MCQRQPGGHLKFATFNLINCFFMRDFIREKRFNSFPKLLINSYRTDADASKILLFCST